MIIYFSGTGNSRHIARMIASETGGKLVCANDLIKNKKRGVFSSELPYVFVCPTYAWRMPGAFHDFISASEFSGNKKAYFILTCGDNTGNARHYAGTLCVQKGLEFMGLAKAVMPENYIAMYDSPSAGKSAEIIKKAEADMPGLAGLIKSQARFPKQKISPVDKLMSSIANPVFYSVFVSAKKFHTTPACTGCGRCAELCPLNNVRMKDNSPAWGKNCTHCMACIGGCPSEAVEYGKISAGKRRHYIK